MNISVQKQCAVHQSVQAVDCLQRLPCPTSMRISRIAWLFCRVCSLPVDSTLKIFIILCDAEAVQTLGLCVTPEYIMADSMDRVDDGKSNSAPRIATLTALRAHGVLNLERGQCCAYLRGHAPKRELAARNLCLRIRIALRSPI